MNLTDVLSEGEQKVVAIAGFLAELALSDSNGPIVLDDPVCSLDHRYRERIARRLVKESLTRQVICFTHDIAFLLEAEAEAGKQKASLTTQTVRNADRTVGACRKGKPWHAMPVRDRLVILSDELALFQDSHDHNREEYNKRAGILYGLLRESWEAAVEEILLAETVVRHRESVETRRLNSVTVTTEDFVEVHNGMDKCSRWMLGHDKSRALDEDRPPPKEVVEDIGALRGFRKRINSREEDIVRERKSALEPKRPAVG